MGSVNSHLCFWDSTRGLDSLQYRVYTLIFGSMEKTAMKVLTPLQRVQHRHSIVIGNAWVTEPLGLVFR